MHVCRVGGSGRAWGGLAAGLGIGLCLALLGLALGLSFLARAQEGSVSAGAATGPLVILTLEKGEKIRGALLEFRDGKVRIQPADGTDERTLQSAEVLDVDFDPEKSVATQATNTGDPTDPKAITPPDPATESKNEPKRPLLDSFHRRRQFAEERRKKIMELVKPRIEARLTPEERNRFHELMPREPNLTPAERKELDALRQKLGMLDPEAFRRLTSEVMDEARQAQRKGALTEFSDGHLKRLRSSMTDDERRRHIGSVFAATRVTGPDAIPPLKDIAVNLMRSTNAPTAGFDEQVKDLRAMYELFCEEVERLDAPQPLRQR
jgi:hypothetical protein